MVADEVSATAGRLAPFVAERVLRDDEDFLIVDKPCGIVVHGGDERRADDLVSRLGAWLRASGRSDYLGVHQRLDLATSGLVFFTRRKELNGAVAAATSRHQIRRGYAAVVRVNRGARLANRGRLEQRLEHMRGRTEIVSSGGKRAVTEYEVLERRGERALLRLFPETGRTHQIRVQLASAGAPICGDRLYGGEPAPRLFLHAVTLSGTVLDGEWTSECPAPFREWLERGELGVSEDISGLLLDAALRRYALASHASAYRLVNGAGDVLPGLVVDVYGDFATLSLYDDAWLERAPELGAQLLGFGLRGVYLKARVRADLRRQRVDELAPELPLAGEAPPEGRVVVEEHGLRVEVALNDGLSTGLFVDQRDNRLRVRAEAAGARVLNLFSYTCSFSVAAALGGAREVVSVDLSKRALARGRRNFELNGQGAGVHRIIQEDAMKWLARAVRRGERFDLVVLDPPSFATVGKQTFSVDKRYGEVAGLVFGLLEPGGRLLAVTNHGGTSPDAFRRILHGAARAAGRRMTTLRDLPSGLDCPEGVEGPWPSKSAWAVVE